MQFKCCFLSNFWNFRNPLPTNPRESQWILVAVCWKRPWINSWCASQPTQTASALTWLELRDLLVLTWPAVVSSAADVWPISFGSLLLLLKHFSVVCGWLRPSSTAHRIPERQLIDQEGCVNLPLPFAFVSFWWGKKNAICCCFHDGFYFCFGLPLNRFVK